MTTPPRERDECEAAVFTEDGETAWECHRVDIEVVTMLDGDKVRLCPRHRSWAAAMGLPEGDTT